MSYYFTKAITDKRFNETLEKLIAELKKEGFGIVTEIDMQETLKQKINVDFRKYKILGACNPHFAYKALSSEAKIGVFLPCNIIVEENEFGEIEVSAVDPVASMIAVKNNNLHEVAMELQKKLKTVIDNM